MENIKNYKKFSETVVDFGSKTFQAAVKISDAIDLLNEQAAQEEDLEKGDKIAEFAMELKNFNQKLYNTLNT